MFWTKIIIILGVLRIGKEKMFTLDRVDLRKNR